MSDDEGNAPTWQHRESPDIWEGMDDDERESRAMTALANAISNQVESISTEEAVELIEETDIELLRDCRRRALARDDDGADYLDLVAREVAIETGRTGED